MSKPRKANAVERKEPTLDTALQSVLFNIGEGGVTHISLWVDGHLKDDGSKEKFYVINGDWYGVYCKGSIYVDFTKKGC